MAQHVLKRVPALGKTRVGLNLIDAFIKRNERSSILVVVPSENLKNQWIDKLEERGTLDNTRVEIINTVVKSSWTCNLLIIDEIHLTASNLFSQVFEKVQYDNILGLTATLERLDGKQELIKKYAPVCDTIPISLAEENGWVAPHKEYCVLLDVDLTQYNKLTKEFNQCFAYFDFNFSVCMSCATNAKYCKIYAKKLGLDWKQVMGMAQKWNRAMRARKDFIYNHPKKLEITNKILDARKDKKCITFSGTIKQAEAIGRGYVIHSKQSKKYNREILEKFDAESCGVLNSSKSAETGLDLKGINTEIIMYTNSSKIRKTQVLGRALRAEEGKNTEIFTLVLRNTQEYNWFQNSNTSEVVYINEEQLNKVLAGETIETREHDNIVNTKFRF